jgi:hypothetical protein
MRMARAEIVTKSEFAHRQGVTPSAVSRWIARGQLAGRALTDDGRIVVAVAQQQLGTRRDPGRGRPSSGGSAAPALAAVRLAKERAILARLQRENAIGEAEFVNAADADRAWREEITDLMAAVEQWLVDDLVPKAVALDPHAGLDPRAAADTARRAWREFCRRRVEQAANALHSSGKRRHRASRINLGGGRTLRSRLWPCGVKGHPHVCYKFR